MNETQVRTYRGDSIEALLPRIRAELGPDAVVLRRREGLVGGIGGFFQKRCVEVDARPAGPRIDVYDDGSPRAGHIPSAPAAAPPVRNDAATREGLATPELRALLDQARPFADLLDDVAAKREGEAEPSPPRRAAELREGLVAAGLGEDIAAEVVDSVVANALPFAAPRRLRTLVRNELALRIPVAHAARSRHRVLALVGPAGAGKTTAVARIAAAQAAAGTAVTCLALGPRDGGKELEAMLAATEARVIVLDAAAQLARAGVSEERDGLVIIDTAPSRAGSPSLDELAAALALLAPDEVHLVLRAGCAAAAAAELAEGLAPLRPNRLLVTGLEETAHLGGVLDLAIRTGVPFGYVAPAPDAIAPADPRALATGITP